MAALAALADRVGVPAVRHRAPARPRDRPTGRAEHRDQPAWAATAGRPPTDWRSPRRRCTAASGGPTPITGWRRPARSSGCGSPASRSTTSTPPPRRCRTSRGCGPTCCAGVRRLRPGDYDESDVRVRSGQGLAAADQDPPRARRRRAARWWSPSTAADGDACSAATPSTGSPRCGPANWAAHRSSSATTSTWSATCPGGPTRWPASCGAGRGERCCGAPPMTPIPPSG